MLDGCDIVTYRYSDAHIPDFFFNDTATTEIYTYCHTLSLHDALPISSSRARRAGPNGRRAASSRRSVRRALRRGSRVRRSEEHTSELQSLMRISYAVFCLKKKNIHRA